VSAAYTVNGAERTHDAHCGVGKTPTESYATSPDDRAASLGRISFEAQLAALIQGSRDLE
jgi:hypothetical protein